MRARAALGQADAIQALLRNLTRALAEIDAGPDDHSMVLADQLTAALRRADRSSPHPEHRTETEAAR